MSDELNTVGKKLALGGDIVASLVEFSNHIKSEKLKKTIMLIVSGLQSGGELTELLDQVVFNLRHEKFVDEKIRANVLMYAVFIFIAIGLGAPLLFGLSSFLVSVLQENLATIDIPQNTPLPITFSEVHISPNFIVFFSVISLITSSLLGSLILGLITKGYEKRGIKFIPILLLLSLSIFFLSRYFIKTLLSNVFGL